MAKRRKTLDPRELLDMKLSELTVLIKDLSPEARVEISLARYEDEDAHVRVYLPSNADEQEVERIESALGVRCNDILLDTGLFILGAVCD
jgi:hypothetical protein